MGSHCIRSGSFIRKKKKRKVDCHRPGCGDKWKSKAGVVYFPSFVIWFHFFLLLFEDLPRASVLRGDSGVSLLNFYLSFCL
jgi:hypothetical protein